MKPCEELVDAIKFSEEYIRYQGYQKQSAQSAAVRAADPRIPPQKLSVTEQDGDGRKQKIWIFMM